MHILHLLASPFVGGPERQVLGLARHLPAEFRTSFLSFSERGLARAFLDEARQESFDAIELLHNTPHFGKCLREVADQISRRQADVLVCSGYKADMIGWRAARRSRIPVVCIAHGWTGATARVRFYEMLDRLVLRWVDSVVCVSQAQVDKLRRVLVPQRKLALIRNAIGEPADPPDTAYGAMLLGLFASPPQRIVGAAGRLSPEKNFALLADAAARVVSQRPDVGFVVFGDGPLRAALSQQIQRLGLSGRFVLPGFRSDVVKYLPYLDLAVMSSTTEGLPVFMLEAFAAGVPMVATSVGGIPEVLEEGRNGFLVPSGNALALARRIIDALDDDTGRRLLGQYARELVRRDFSFERQARQYAALFTRLAGTGPVPVHSVTPAVQQDSGF